uniref:Uncharacterized protein n=1 Tax=Trichuris muris TaxID=70415 RepID=A0A5S6QEG7_TRIMR
MQPNFRQEGTKKDTWPMTHYPSPLDDVKPKHQRGSTDRNVEKDAPISTRFSLPNQQLRTLETHTFGSKGSNGHVANDPLSIPTGRCLLPELYCTLSRHWGRTRRELLHRLAELGGNAPRGVKFDPTGLPPMFGWVEELLRKT